MNPRASFLVMIFAVTIVAAVAAVLLTLAVVDRQAAAPMLPRIQQPQATTVNPDADWIEAMDALPGGFSGDISNSEQSRQAERDRQQDREICELRRQAGDYTSCFP